MSELRSQEAQMSPEQTFDDIAYAVARIERDNDEVFKNYLEEARKIVDIYGQFMIPKDLEQLGTCLDRARRSEVGNNTVNHNGQSINVRMLLNLMLTHIDARLEGSREALASQRARLRTFPLNQLFVKEEQVWTACKEAEKRYLASDFDSLELKDVLALDDNRRTFEGLENQWKRLKSVLNLVVVKRDEG